MMPLEAKLARIGGNKFEISEQRQKTLKIFFFETRRCRALIFGMLHLLVDVYQVCSYDALGVKTGPAPGVTNVKHSNKEGKLQNSSSLKLGGLELWYLVYSISLRTSTKFAPGVKTGPALGVHKLEHRNKEAHLQFFFFETGWRRDLLFAMWHLLVDLYQVCS